MKTLLHFSNLPLVNTLSETADSSVKGYDLEVVYDPDTHRVYLNNNVSPDLLFTDDYVYDSSQSSTMRHHFNSAYWAIKNRFNPKTVLEIGSNSGIFIRHFLNNAKPIAVEPCSNFADITNAMGIPTYDNYWGEDAVMYVLSTVGKVDVVYSANTFSHIQDLITALMDVEAVMSDNGVFVMESPSLMEVVTKHAFDQFYHEHHSYFSLSSIMQLLDMFDMEVFDIEQFNVHGGTNRYYIRKRGGTSVRSIYKGDYDRLYQEITKEHIAGLSSYEGLAIHFDIMKSNIKAIHDQLVNLKDRGYKVAGYGATAKFVNVMNMCNLTVDHIQFVLDTTPAKHGLFIPNTGVEIQPYEVKRMKDADVFYLGAWNYLEEVKNKEFEYLNNGGMFMTHIPTLTFV